MAMLYTINGCDDNDDDDGSSGNDGYYDNCKQHVADYTTSPLVHFFCLLMRVRFNSFYCADTI